MTPSTCPGSRLFIPKARRKDSGSLCPFCARRFALRADGRLVDHDRRGRVVVAA